MKDMSEDAVEYLCFRDGGKKEKRKKKKKVGLLTFIAQKLDSKLWRKIKLIHFHIFRMINESWDDDDVGVT